MRVALISDIHGNAFALDAALADIRSQGVDRIVCLGDAIQGGAQPAETVQRLRELGCPVVMGNADAWLLTGRETGGEGVTAAQEEVRQWSLARLSTADRAYIEGFAPTVRTELGERDVLLCFHGSPSNFDDIILPGTPYETVTGYVEGHGATWLAGGHTHMQQVRHVGTCTFFNPGSVGRPFRHEQFDRDLHIEPRADYAILTRADGVTSLEFRRVALDTGALFAVLRASGHPRAEALVQEYGG